MEKGLILSVLALFSVSQCATLARQVQVINIYNNNYNKDFNFNIDEVTFEE